MKYINNIYLSIPVILLLMYFPVVAQQSDLVEHITVETSLNQVFISSRPVIQSPEDLNRYLELTRSRLDLVDSGTEISAVVTFTRPMSYNELSAIFGSQIGGSLVITGDQTDPLEIPYPLPPDDSDLNNSDSVIIAAKVYGNAGFVKGLAGQDRTPGWVAARYGNKAIVEQYAFSGKPVKVRGQHHLASIGAAMQPGMIIRYAE